jgi:serine/threonine protein kinase
MSRPSLVEEIFLAALEKPAIEERAAFLDGACRGDAGLRDEVDRLLLAHPSAGRFLEPPIAEATADFNTSKDEKAGVVIAGRYKLLEPIGEGGMGSVWMAQQTEPVKRVVALKLIKEGMDTRAVLARFEAERQALALMDHPNIARVLDAGSTSDGRPFFVMELVKGVPITRYCDDRKLTLRQRLELFVPVCQAVQHAHQKGVIHRDLKPTNVLVARYDDHPVPKVIDFGVAKAAGQPLTDHTLVTGFGAVVGTPEYMSPEQAQFNQLDIDTRSDVYALGVLLYELLTGSTPFTRKEFEKAGLLEILRVIREQEPPRPSTRLSTADALPTLAANRGSEPRTLAGLLKNDLDWIVMKAMEKDRNRRYETATGFAADVQRYLAGEAVQAHPPSTAYRMKKFARKHKAALITVAAFVSLLIAAVGVSALLAMKARRAEILAEAKAKEADENANRYWKVAAKEQEAQDKLRVSETSLRMDLALAELRDDARVGLLKLVRTLPPNMTTIELTEAYFSVFSSKDPAERKTIELGVFPGIWDEFRQFATMAILAHGQKFAPLLPPIDHDGRQVLSKELTSTGLRLLTSRSEDRTARLWDAATGRQLAILRKGSEEVLHAGLSPDGATAFTHSTDGVVRFWNTDDGTLRAQTEARADRFKASEDNDQLEYHISEITHISNDRLITSTFVAKATQNPAGGYVITKEGNYILEYPGPVELWDARTGRLVGALELPKGFNAELVSFFGQGRWIWITDRSRWYVYSAADGRKLAEIGKDHHIYERNTPEILVSPSGATISARVDFEGKESIETWDTASWKPISLTGPFALDYRRYQAHLKEYIYENLIAVQVQTENIFGVDVECHVYRIGQAEPIARLPITLLQLTPDRVLIPSGQVFERASWRRLQPPKGRKYHPDIARFAQDGRFVDLSSALGYAFTDIVTEKSIDSVGGIYVPKVGWISSERPDSPLPPPDHLKIDTDLLEHWAKVAVRGELDDEGVFVKWNEETWEKKRQELASKPAPYPDFPFPGHVATDRLHWLRKEYEAASEADQPRLARQLLDRAEKAGDTAEATRWRAFVAPKADPPGK